MPDDRLGAGGVRHADLRRKPSFRDPGPDPIKVDATHWIYPANTEYELFTVGKAATRLGASS